MREMLILAACLFAAAALGGLFMAVRIFKKADAPLSVALLHGAAAAAGLVTLLIAVLSSGGFGAPGLALTVLLAAALGGFFLFSFHLRKRPWPTPVVVVHAAVAVTGFAILLYAILTSAS